MKWERPTKYKVFINQTYNGFTPIYNQINWCKHSIGPQHQDWSVDWEYFTTGGAHAVWKFITPEASVLFKLRWC